jgi:hypothetical protein
LSLIVVRFVQSSSVSDTQIRTSNFETTTTKPATGYQRPATDSAWFFEN